MTKKRKMTRAEEENNEGERGNIVEEENDERERENIELVGEIFSENSGDTDGDSDVVMDSKNEIAGQLTQNEIDGESEDGVFDEKAWEKWVCLFIICKFA